MNLWDYHLQTFRFEDGRLVLRGANGSGKTKALEVLVPFVLDGSIDARRLDPFSATAAPCATTSCGAARRAHGRMRGSSCGRARAVTIGIGMRDLQGQHRREALVLRRRSRPR